MSDLELNQDSKIKIPIFMMAGFIGVLITVFTFGIDLRNSNRKNSTSIKNLEHQMKINVDLIRRENHLLEARIQDDLNSIKIEQRALQQSMLNSISEIRKIVYRIDGRLSVYKEEGAK